MTSNVVIDLTASSPHQQPKLSITPGDTSAPHKAKQPSSKKKRKNGASSIVNGASEQSDAPRASVEPPRPLAEAEEAAQIRGLPKKPPTKRKRGYADPGPEPAAGLSKAASEDRDRPGSLKRHKADQSDGLRKAPTFLAPVLPALDVSVMSETAKPEKKKRNHGSKARRAKDTKKKDTTSDKEDGELTEAEVSNPPTVNGSSSTNKQHRKRSESPSRRIPKVSGERRKKKSKSASRQKAASDTESVQSSMGHMFFVDLDPTKDVVYEKPEVKSKYRVEQGNLLLPHHVLLETAEERQISLSTVEVPPADDTDSETEDDFQLIENSNGFQRYFDQPKLHQVEPCELCRQVHSSKICPGLVCHACGVIGQHTTNGCPQSIVCFRCGKRGHISRECNTPREMLRDWRCALCHSQRHNTVNCSLQWRIYVYRTPEERHAELERRKTLKMFILNNPTGEPIDTEAYISTNPYCYYCASRGHLGDHCPDPQRSQDCQEEPSSHNLDHLLNGPYGRLYQERQRFAQPGQTLFGDLLIDEEGMTGVGGDFQFNYGRADDVTPFTQPGRAGREKQMQRLAQQQPHRGDDDDWFDNQRGDHGRLRQQQLPPSRNIRVNYRSSGPVLDAQYYPAPPPPPPPLPYAPLPLPPAPMVPPPHIYFDEAQAGPRPGPSRPGPSRGYPSSHEISAGYQHAPQPNPPKRELSIRGAAQRRQEQDRSQRGAGGRDRSGEGREWDRGKEWSNQDGHPEWGQRSDRYHNNHRRRY